MNEISVPRRKAIRVQLLATASVGAFLVLALGESKAEDADRPIVWIDLGGQTQKVTGFGGALDEPFVPELVNNGFTSPTILQRALNQSVGGEGAITFQPENSDWIFTLSAIYGRANGIKEPHQGTAGGKRKACAGTYCGYLYPSTVAYSDPHIRNDESHTVVDFQVGKDVGLGLFNLVRSQFEVGLRVAQFTSKQTFDLHADPDFYFPSKIVKYDAHHHAYEVSSIAERSFHGVGPSVSWKASAPLLGKPDGGGLTFDWGVNGALLFGRQKMQSHHQTTGFYYKSRWLFSRHVSIPSRYVHRSENPIRSRALVVPNLGGFAGLSFRFQNAKVSIGYKADFFFNAMDNGIDTRKSETLGFHGPFATISVGFP